MTDFYGVSAKPARPEQRPMSDDQCERKISLLRACWTYFDDVSALVSAALERALAEEDGIATRLCVT